MAKTYNLFDRKHELVTLCMSKDIRRCAEACLLHFGMRYEVKGGFFLKANATKEALSTFLAFLTPEQILRKYQYSVSLDGRTTVQMTHSKEPILEHSFHVPEDSEPIGIITDEQLPGINNEVQNKEISGKMVSYTKSTLYTIQRFKRTL